MNMKKILYVIVAIISFFTLSKCTTEDTPTRPRQTTGIKDDIPVIIKGFVLDSLTNNPIPDVLIVEKDNNTPDSTFIRSDSIISTKFRIIGKSDEYGIFKSLFRSWNGPRFNNLFAYHEEYKIWRFHTQTDTIFYLTIGWDSVVIRLSKK